MNNYFVKNEAFFVCYKSSRKNAKASDIIFARHLITNENSGKIADDRIIDQFIGVVEKIVNYCKNNNHVELSCNVSINREATKNTINNPAFAFCDTRRFSFGRKQFYSIESAIAFIFDIFTMVYPYSKISENIIFNNESIKYFINYYYHN